jgi:hypothetical protein
MHIHPDIFLFFILLLIVLGIAVRILYRRAKGSPLRLKWTRTIKYIGQISLALGVLLQLMELTHALEHINDSLSKEQIALGLRSTLYASIHGLLVYVIAMILFSVLMLTEKQDRTAANLNKP